MADQPEAEDQPEAADQPESVDRPQPYVPRNAGDVIRSEDWNNMQVKAIEEIHRHRHTGGENGSQIPREGIEAKAIDGSLIDPAAEVTLKSLTINKGVNGISPSLYFNTASAHWRMSVQEELDAGLEIASGEISQTAATDTYTNRITIKAETGNVGIGTTTPKTTLDVEGGAFGFRRN